MRSGRQISKQEILVLETPSPYLQGNLKEYVGPVKVRETQQRKLTMLLLKHKKYFNNAEDQWSK